MKSQFSPLAVGFILLAAILAVLLWQSKQEFAQQDAQQKDSTKHYRQLVGGTSLWAGSHGEMISYNLRSFDDGHTWVAVQYDDDWRMKILGDAEIIFPGLIAQVQAMNTLVSVAQNSSGKLDISTSSNQKLLKAAGFEVVSTK